jgi:hypothetical protein
MSIDSDYIGEEVLRGRDCFVFPSGAVRHFGYFTRRELNEMGAKSFGSEDRWFVKGQEIYGLSAVVFEDGVERFRKLLSGRPLLELA